ncbi:MAG: nickel pincer cofactor biosynthesis protein LarB [Kiloniellales bacterium]
MTQDLRFDWEREARTGVPEAVLAEGKSRQQIAAILAEASARATPLLITRLSSEAHAALPPTARETLDYDPVSRTAFLGPLDPPEGAAEIAILSAGQADLPVALEAERCLGFFGLASRRYADVGVSGLWRLLDVAEELQSYRLLIVAAGMEGALFSVVAGLVKAPVIAVPTSVGYGVARDGELALRSALASCAPGVLVVNIDNGFGAAAAARKMLARGV